MSHPGSRGGLGRPSLTSSRDQSEPHYLFTVVPAAAERRHHLTAFTVQSEPAVCNPSDPSGTLTNIKKKHKNKNGN